MIKILVKILNEKRFHVIIKAKSGLIIILIRRRPEMLKLFFSTSPVVVEKINKAMKDVEKIFRIVLDED